MTRLAILVEGLTEEVFVRQVLADYLMTRGVGSYAIQLGGNVTVQGIVLQMQRLSHSFDAVTSLVDYYGFKQKGKMSPQELEARIFETVCERIERTKNLDRSKIIPYIQQYEFEGLLFSDLHVFANQNIVPISAKSLEKLQIIRSGFRCPEDINDGRMTAPSKRLKMAIPEYRKWTHGSQLAKRIGLDVIRKECPRFDHWIERLESLEEG